MNTHKLLACTLAGLVLTFGLGAPVFAQKNTGPSATADTAAAAGDIDFGDDTSQWANDGECDDPRFGGAGSASELVEADLKKDATDCKAAYEAGTITLSAATDSPVANAEVDFGDDTSQWSNDDECDDPRFEGTGSASELLEDDTMHDATDCRTAYEAGTITLKTPGSDTAVAFDYGTDNSQYANDGECDDVRFTGTGMDKKLLSEDTSSDATDCRTLVESGSLSIIPVYDPAYTAGAPYDTKGVNFGDNTSDYADDQQCDDPRFQGPGAASTLLDGDLRHDRNDCKAAFEAGTVILID